jgi:2-(1,2-epoxy-1,2-dihydrophenyl)acetyl-CoA isomerase
MGLIWQCVDDAEFPAAVQALAARLAAMPSRALAETRRLVDASAPADLAQALSWEAQAQGELGRAPDFAEGVAAFFAKRSPSFKDR